MNRSNMVHIRVGLRGRALWAVLMQEGKLIKNNNRVILLITFAQAVALYPGVSF